MIEAAPRLGGYRDAWNKKPALRVIYHDYYRRILENVGPGVVLEVGGGSGNFKQFASRVISTDIQWAPWLDAVADAHMLPFADAAFDGIVMVDVLHHLEAPVRFLQEAQRVLKPRGRLVLIEPAITPFSWIVYRFFHHEPVRMDQDPLADVASDPHRDPYDSNSALPTLLFGRARHRLRQKCPGLVVRDVRQLGLLAYLLSGGFRSWSLLPEALAIPMLRLERAAEGVLGRFMGLRLLAVLERI